MTLEVCCGSPQAVDAAVKRGAQRVELCSALDLDGLTPPLDWLVDARRRYPALRIHVLIRPRPGDFCYTPAEVEQMCTQIEDALSAGADGIVIGCLTPSGDVDIPAMEKLLETVRCFELASALQSDRCHASNDEHFFENLNGENFLHSGVGQQFFDLFSGDKFLVREAQKSFPKSITSHKTGILISVTFHRAFDVCRKPMKAMEDIIDLGIDRILTSGQAPSAQEGIPLLRRLVKKARGRIIIMPGAGITPDNLEAIEKATGASEFHGSRIMGS